MSLSMLARAALSAALTPSLPSWPTLSLSVARWDRSHLSADPAALQDRMLACLALHASVDPWRLPWASGEELSLRRLAAALIGRSDDYTGPLPVELLPAAEARVLMDALKTAAAAAGRPLDVCEQLAVALVQTDGQPLAAVLLLHIATRTLARGADARRDPCLSLWLDERLALGTSIAAFDPVLCDGDPLGDARHYWAMVCAGVASVWAKRTGRRGAGRVLHAAFFLAPEPARRLRQRLEGPHPDRGRLSRMGLRHGISLGVAAARQAERGQELPGADATARATLDSDRAARW